jgi:hypothetical protein
MRATVSSTARRAISAPNSGSNKPNSIPSKFICGQRAAQRGVVHLLQAAACQPFMHRDRLARVVDHFLKTEQHAGIDETAAAPDRRDSRFHSSSEANAMRV